MNTLIYFLYAITKYGKSKKTDINAYLGIDEKVPVRVGKISVLIEKSQ